MEVRAMEVQHPTPKLSRQSISPLMAIAPGPTRVIRTSMPLRWQGLLLEKHLTSPGERAAASIDKAVISLNTGSSSRFEHRTASGDFVACLNRPGTVMTTPPGRIPDLRLHTSSEFLHCALDEEFTHGVLEELGSRTLPASRFRPGIQDKPIRCLLGMLADELEADTQTSRLYVDSLAHALATRYLCLDCDINTRSESGVSPLPLRILNRVRDKIEANLDTGLSLKCLAEVSGYSRAHFLRMFRVATGMTPHQYVLGLRLQRAQDALRQKNASIVDVAVSCGFSSQSHMTNIFRQHLETTPAAFRRSA